MDLASERASFPKAAWAFPRPDRQRIVIPIHCSSIRIEDAVLEFVGDLVEPVRSWNDFENRATSNPVAIIAMERDGIPNAHRAEHLTRSAASTRFALVIDDAAIEYDLLGRLTVWKVVPLSQAARVLRSVVLEACQDDGLAWVVDSFASIQDVPSHLRKAIRIACLGPSIKPTVTGLATEAGCSRRALSRAWRRSCATNCGITLEEFLAWITLLRALALRQRYKSWEEMGMHTGLSVATLGRRAVSLMSVSLAKLDHAHAREVFVASVLTPITTRVSI